MSLEKYKNKYRIKSARLEGYDYSKAGLYFITICTHGMKHYFGKVVNNGMQLSEIGKIAENEWHDSLNHRKNIVLHEFVVMPNHIHGIIEIVEKNDTYCMDDVRCRDVARIVSTVGTEQTKSSQMKKILPKSGSLGRIIGGYKSAVTKNAHQLGLKFQWQTRYYDHIIRNYKSYNIISEYIKNNPDKWYDDKFNNKNK